MTRQPVYLQVADQIREAILDGRMAQGQPLPSERSLQESLGVGRTTVREALRALEAQGLVGRGPGGWRSVASPSLDAPLQDAIGHLVRLQVIGIDDLADLRLILETGAVVRAAAIRDPQAIARARACLEEMHSPGLAVSSFQDADVRFHVALAAASGNEALHLIMLTLREVINRYMREMADHVGDMAHRLPQAVRDHSAILEAIERGDGEAAATATTDHLVRAHGLLRRWMAQDAPSTVGEER